MNFQTIPRSRTDIQTMNVFLRGVFNWMSVGLGLTALVAYGVATTPAIVMLFFFNLILFWGLILAQFGLVAGFEVDRGGEAERFGLGRGQQCRQPHQKREFHGGPCSVASVASRPMQGQGGASDLA